MTMLKVPWSMGLDSCGEQAEQISVHACILVGV